MQGLRISPRPRVTKKCTRVADRAFREVKVARRQPGDFSRSSYLILVVIVTVCGFRFGFPRRWAITDVALIELL